MDDLVAQSAERLFADWSARAIAAMPVEAEHGDMPFLDDLWQAVEGQGFGFALLTEEAGGFGLAVEDALRIVELASEHAIALPLGETMVANWLKAAAGLRPAEGPATFGVVASGVAQRLAWARDIGQVVLVSGEEGLCCLQPGQHRIEHGRNIVGEPRATLYLQGAVEWRRAPIGTGTVEALGAMLRAFALSGSLRRVLRMCLDHAGQREQFGKPLGRFQVLQHNLAMMASQTAAASAAARGAGRAFAAFADGRASAEEFLAHAACAKIRTGEAAGLCAGWAHQLHGAIGYSHEYPLHVFTRRLWSCRDEWGSEAVWSDRLGGLMLERPDFWAALTDLGEVVA